MAVNVAIFEDNRLLREMLTQLINGTQGYSCVGSFPDANNAIQKIQRAVPDVILMDIEMPGTNGIEAVRLIKEHYPAVLIIMQTVIEDNDKIFDAICAGASGYLLKNTAPARLLEAINEANAGGSPMSPSVARKVLEKFSIFRSQSQKQEFDLTEREKEILQHLVKGMSYKMIADACFLSIDTVKFHIKNIYDKLQVNSKAEAVAKAFKSGLA
ncbi:MAG: response regulator transcription factor [Bacteroidetes bacterium]|jgi:DNA-binding NarL/FixJ family response regulator|nr:response regulator transcription factor [Bacteroidota bacterium]MBK6837340.1 response regulator transcription factor [Bacteroidota bacterium]MBK9523249.1 response regulator transcription factor [Bacteroidota bacterium]MBK9540993.1 response regulator transcription factor [Bacteroidota bacterium]